MENSKEKRRVKLTDDLTKYGEGLIVGLEGWTIPNVKLSIWGTEDRFVAVEFDNKVKLDVALSSLDFVSSN
jgi:hypothetical protein